MRIVFLGTPDFAVKPLQSLIDNGYNVVAVVTNKDKPVGRKQILTACPVKQTAIANNITVFQYDKIRKEGVEDLKALAPDLMVTCAFGQILSQEILDIPKIGTFNIHASLLPKYRGSSPIQWAIINGETKTGVTIMMTDAGVDTGDVILQDTIAIDDEDNAESLFEKLSELGSKSIIKALKQIETGSFTRIKQDNGLATGTTFLTKESGKIDFNKTAKEIVNLVRGVNPWPIAFCSFNNEQIKVYKATVVAENSENLDIQNAKNGEVIYSSTKTGLIVKTGSGLVRLNSLKKEGGKLLNDTDFLNGNKIPVGTVIN